MTQQSRELCHAAPAPCSCRVFQLRTEPAAPSTVEHGQHLPPNPAGAGFSGWKRRWASEGLLSPAVGGELRGCCGDRGCLCPRPKPHCLQQLKETHKPRERLCTTHAPVPQRRTLFSFPCCSRYAPPLPGQPEGAAGKCHSSLPVRSSCGWEDGCSHTGAAASGNTNNNLAS